MCTTTIVLRLYNYDPNRIAFDRTERYYFVTATLTSTGAVERELLLTASCQVQDDTDR